MSKIAVEHIFSGGTTGYTSYASTKTVLGTLMRSFTGTNAIDNYVGPAPIAMARPNEESTALPSMYPSVFSYSPTLDWVFLADNAAAAATRRVNLYEFNKTTNVFVWNGFITLTLPTATVHTIRGFEAFVNMYSTGTVVVNGTAVSGTSTTWTSSTICAGSRIGFGDTKSTGITTWYEIATIESQTGLTLTTNAGASGSTPYVIEDMRMVMANTNATAANGGLFMAKGIRYENFAPGGTTIAAAVSTDNVRAAYWLADATVVTNTASAGLARDSAVDLTTQFVYIPDTNNRIYKYNIMSPLSGLTAGKTTGASVFLTGVQAVTGTMSQVGNGIVATANHGAGAGIPSLYFITTTRVYRAALSGITSGTTLWQSDSTTEIPPGGTGVVFNASATMSNIKYDPSIDRFYIINTGANDAKSYLTKYISATQFDRVFLSSDGEFNQSTAGTTAAHPSVNVSPFSMGISSDGMVYLVRHSAASTLNQLYAIPFGADWDFASTTNQRVITPSISTPNANKFYRVYVNAQHYVGSDTGLAVVNEPFRVYYRTAGITNNSGAWTLLDDSGTLTSISPTSEIQFMFEFRQAGMSCVPAKLYSVACVYEDDTTDSHYQPSIGLSDKSTKTFAWRFSSAFGGTVPPLRVRLFDAVTNSSLVDDNTSAPTGTFEQTLSGGTSWSTWTNSDKTNEITYIRYTPSSLGDNIKVRALLTQL
jgi:hypothetical protein